MLSLRMEDTCCYTCQATSTCLRFTNVPVEASFTDRKQRKQESDPDPKEDAQAQTTFRDKASVNAKKQKLFFFLIPIMKPMIPKDKNNSKSEIV